MIADLINAGYFRQITTEGRKTLVLRNPVQVVIKSSVLRELKAAYPLHEETGGILYAYADGKGGLIINQWRQLTNTLTTVERKTAYRPGNFNAAVNNALNAGALPIRFHSHPVSIYENPYDRQPLTFFQKTSVADRHNSYMPFNVGGYTIALPDGLLTANDRSGNDIRFYLYGGFVAPDSLKALLTAEKVYVYFAISLILFAYLFGGYRKAGLVFILSAIASLFVFIAEKRPTGVRNADGDLIISIP